MESSPDAISSDDAKLDVAVDDGDVMVELGPASQDVQSESGAGGSQRPQDSVPDGRSEVANSVSGGHIHSSIVGSKVEHLYQYNLRPDGESSFVDTSFEGKFCLAEVEYSEELVASLVQYRDFYREHRWLIIARNDQNRFGLDDITAKLLEPNKEWNYRYQTEVIECRNFIRHKEKLTYDMQTLTKVVVVRNTENFVHFFRESDNMTGLSKALIEANNTLIFVVEEKVLIDAKLDKCFGDKKKSAIWTPEVPGKEEAPSQDSSDFEPPQQYVTMLCAWFNCLPYPVFRHLVTCALKPTAESLAVQRKASKEYPAWWTQWKAGPQQSIDAAGVANLLIPDSTIYGARFRQLQRQFHEQKRILDQSCDVTIYWPHLRRLLYTEGELGLSLALWASHFAAQLAAFLDDMGSRALLKMDAALLTSLWQEMLESERWRSTFDRFSLLIRHLYLRDSTRQVVEGFFGDLIQSLRESEHRLITATGNTQDSVRLLTLCLNDTEQFDALDAETAHHLVILRRHSEMVCYLLLSAVDSVDEFTSKCLLRLMTPPTMYVATIKNELPVTVLVMAYLRDELERNPPALAQLVEQWTRSIGSDDVASAELRQAMQLSQHVWREQLSQAATFSNDYTSLNYIYAMLMLNSAVETLLRLYRPSSNNKKLAMTFKDLAEILLVFARLHCEVEVHRDGDDELDKALERVLSALANAIERSLYLDGKSFCSEALAGAKRRIGDFDAETREQRQKKKKRRIAEKNAWLFLKKSFKK
jgi:hypothetical protein